MSQAHSWVGHYLSLPELRSYTRRTASASLTQQVGAHYERTHIPGGQDYCIWTTDRPAVLMDSANAGTDLGVEYPSGGLPDQARRAASADAS